jgi:DNA repair exonuclease SbcCD ATPase subunit
MKSLKKTSPHVLNQIEKDRKMANSTYCTNCGKQISITARFCRFCGNPAKKKRSTQPSPTSSSSPPVAPPTPVARPLPRPAESIEKIPEEIVDILYARERKTQIKAELKELLDEIDELSKKVDIGLIEEEESSQKIETIQTQISSLQEEQKTLKSQPLELETFTVSENKWQQRIEKLEEKKRTQMVSNEVYNSLKDEYNSEYATIQKKVAIEERKARRWLVDLQKEVRELETQVERFKVRGEIEGLSQEEIKTKSEQSTLERKRKAAAARILTEILSNL